MVIAHSNRNEECFNKSLCVCHSGYKYKNHFFNFILDQNTLIDKLGN